MGVMRTDTSTLDVPPLMHAHPGDVIRRLRLRLGMTQEEFAHAIAVTVSTVNRWENAHAAPSKLAWKAIRDLARRRGVTEQLQAPQPATGGR
jgi:DNA-binding transcriptional regulator YiaG